MLARSHHPMAPWTTVRADERHQTRFNVIRGVLGRLHYKDEDERLIRPDPERLFSFDTSYLENGLLAP